MLAPPFHMCLEEVTPVRFCYAVSWPKGFSTSDRWDFSPVRQILPKSPLHVGMSKAMSCPPLCVWIDRSVCHVGMLRAVCLLGPWKLVTLYCGSRDYPWKEPGCPLFSSLLSNSLTLILLSSGLLPSAWTHAVTLTQMWGGGSAALQLCMEVLMWQTIKRFPFWHLRLIRALLNDITCVSFVVTLHHVLLS